MKTTNESLSNGGRYTLDISTITCNNRLCLEPGALFQNPYLSAWTGVAGEMEGIEAKGEKKREEGRVLSDALRLKSELELAAYFKNLMGIFQRQ